MDEILNQILAKMDVEAIFVIQGATSLVKFFLNLVAKDTYTDFVAPFVAVMTGMMMAYAQGGFNLNQFIYGLKLAGMAILFTEISDKFRDGWTWFRKGKSDPLMKAKMEASSLETEHKISKVKALLGETKYENS